MSLDKRTEATAKNIEGKIQEAFGKLTGNQADELEGQAKQGEAAAMHLKEDLKDQAKKIIDRA
ncbi:MAG: CsbD family protein [Actinomycetota bacterium]